MTKDEQIIILEELIDAMEEENLELITKLKKYEN